MSLLEEILANKSLKAKQQTETMATWLQSELGDVSILIQVAALQKDITKANCIEALENCTKTHPEKCTEPALEFVIEQLSCKTPRVKWESARVIGNCIHLYPHLAQKAMMALLQNAKHEGTVVRWSAAFALGEIIKLKLKLNTQLLEWVEELVMNEEKNSIKKIYQIAMKKAK